MVSSILGSRESAWSSRTRRAELLRKGIITRRRKGAKVWLRQAVLLCGKWCRPSWARVSRPGPVERGGQNYYAKALSREGAKAQRFGSGKRFYCAVNGVVHLGLA